MDEQELSNFVIKQLGKSKHLDDLIPEVCQKTGWIWSQAAEFVQRVQEEHGTEIAKKQLPLLFILALGIFLGGLGLVAYSILTSIEIWNGLSGLGNGKAPDTGTYISLQMLIQSGGLPIISFVTGIAMMLGSLIGMRDVWSNILNR